MSYSYLNKLKLNEVFFNNYFKFWKYKVSKLNRNAMLYNNQIKFNSNVGITKYDCIAFDSGQI